MLPSRTPADLGPGHTAVAADAAADAAADCVGYHSWAVSLVRHRKAELGWASRKIAGGPGPEARHKTAGRRRVAVRLEEEHSSGRGPSAGREALRMKAATGPGHRVRAVGAVLEQATSTIGFRGFGRTWFGCCSGKTGRRLSAAFVEAGTSPTFAVGMS